MSDASVSRSSGKDEHRAADQAGLLAVWIVFALTRFYLLLMFLPQFSDLQVYFGYAVRGVDLHQTPYRDIEIEYPPVAYWLMAVPRLTSGEAIPEDVFQNPGQLGQHYSNYASSFRWMLLGVDLVCFLLFLAVIRRRDSDQLSSAAWGYVVSTAVLGHFLYDRLDLGLSLLFMTWLCARDRWIDGEGRTAWNAFSYFVLGLSVSYKLIGVVAFPFVLLADLHAARRAQSVSKAMVLPVLCSVAGGLGPFLLHYPTAGWSTLDFLKYHGERGVQIESVYASLLMACSALGHEIAVQMGHGSANLASSLSSALASGSTYAVLGSLLVLAGWSLKKAGGFGGTAGTRAAVLAILLTLLFSKVLSAQYLIFAFPLMLLLSAELLSVRAGAVVSLAVVVLSVLTTIVVPYCWFNIHPITGIANPFGLVPELNPLTCGILVVRNLLFAMLVVWLVCRVVWPVKRREAALFDE